MRIAYVVSRYPYLSHTFILREVAALRRAGAHVDTYTVRRAGAGHMRSEAEREADATTVALVPPAPRELVAAHARALLTRPRRYLATLRLALALRAVGARAALWQLFYFGEAVLLWNHCSRRRTRHIHAHHANVASDVALLAATLGGHGWSWSFTMHGPTELFDVPGHRLARKTELADFVVCISQYARSQVMGLVGTGHWPKLHVVHCGLELDRFPAVERGERDGPPEILSIGRAVPEKGQALLVEALADLARRGIRARATIAGDGPALAELRELSGRLGVDDRLELPGAVDQGEVSALYARADVFALPSFAEGLPVVLMEAMASGLPVVAARIAGVPELVDDGVSGLVVAPGRADTVADALFALLTVDAARRTEMGRAGRGKVEREFDVDGCARKLLELFASVNAPLR